MAETISMEFEFNTGKAQSNAMKMAAALERIYIFSKDKLSNSAKSFSSATSKFFEFSSGKIKNASDFIGKSIGNIWSEFQGSSNMAKKSFDGLGDAAGKSMTKAVVMGNLITNAIMSGVNLLKSKMGQAMPFVSQTIDQLSTVFFNNLFYPMQRELMPILMRLSNWVAENRINFVKLGTVLVSIFKAAWTIISNFFGMIKNVADKMFEGIFGKGQMTFDRFVNFINLILLKIVFVFMFVQMLIEPLINGIGDLLSSVFSNAVMPFFEGFGEGFSKWVEPISEAFKELGFSLTGLSESLSPLKPIFKFIGYIIGNVIGMAVWFVIKAFKVLIDTVKLFFRGVRWISDLGKDIKNGIGNSINWIIEKFNGAWNSVKNSFAIVWDWIKGKFNSMFDSPVVKKLVSLFESSSPTGKFGGAGASGSFSNVQSVGGAIQPIKTPVIDSGRSAVMAPNRSVQSPVVAGSSSRTEVSHRSSYTGGPVTIHIDGGDPQKVKQAVTQAVSRSSYAQQFYKESQAKGLK